MLQQQAAAVDDVPADDVATRSSIDRQTIAWGLAGVALAGLEFWYGMLLHLGELLATLGGSDVNGYVRMSEFPSWREALAFAGDRALGFPVFLWLVRLVAGPSITAMCWALFAVHLVAAGTFYAALRRRFGLHPVALFLLVAFPGIVAYTTAPMTDAFATDLVMLALAGAVAERPLAAAVAFGWVVLVRPSILVPALLVLGLVVVQLRSVRSVVAVLVFGAILGWQSVNCWRVYDAVPCLVAPSATANTLGWGLNLGRTNVRIYFSRHTHGGEVLVNDPWLVAHAADAPLWLAPRLAWFVHHPVVLVVTVLKKTVALLDVRTRSVDERPGDAVDATPRWYRWFARPWDAAACAGVALALFWVWDRRWTIVAVVPLIHYLAQSPLHVPPRYGLTAVPCALALLVWTAQRRRLLLAVAALVAAAFYWQVSAWDRIDVTLQQIEAWS